MKTDIRSLAIIFSASFACLAFEITLTRIFSISLWYHFAFMVISIAMLGLAIGGMLTSYLPRMSQIRHLPAYGLLLGISIFLGYLASRLIPFDPVKFQWDKSQFFYIGCYYLFLLLPFLFSGLILTIAFSELSHKSGTVYAADLAGAAAGSLTVLMLLGRFPPEQVVLFTSLFMLTVILILGKKLLKIISLIIVLLFSLTMLIPFIDIAPKISPYKEMPRAMAYPDAAHLGTFYNAGARVDVFRSPAVRFAPGLSLAYTEPLPPQIGLSVDGDQVQAITGSTGTESLRFLAFLPAAAAFETGKGNDVLVINPGAGLPVLMAGFYGSVHIDSVEPNTLIYRVIRTKYRNFSAQLGRENAWIGMGRSWLKSRKKTYDIIDVSLLANTPAGPAGLSEDYQLTVEAFQTYIRHLKPDGRISINLFIIPPPRQSLRVITTVTEAMIRAGISNPRLHIAVIRSWASMTILVKKSVFRQNEINKLKQFSRNRMFDILHCPRERPDPEKFFIRTPDNLFFSAFQSLLNDRDRHRFMKNYLFDITPATDDSPFFHHFLKIKNTKKIFDMTGKKWDYFIREGYILPMILIQVILIGAAFIFIPLLFRMRSGNRGQRAGQGGMPLLFFASLGLGFMFVEVSLVQKMIRLFANPQIALAVVLASLLTGAGTGSYLSSRKVLLRKPGFMLLIPPAIVILTIILIPRLIEGLLSLPLFLKLISMAAVLVPLGFFLGIPFPSGIRRLGEKQKDLIPWAWAVNGFFSVLGPIVTMHIALVSGFASVLWLGSLAYLLAYIVSRSSWHHPPKTG